MMLAFGMVSALLAVRRRRRRPGRRCGDERRRGADRGHDLRAARGRPVEGRARGEPARRRHRDLRHLPLLGRQVRRGRSDRAAVPAGACSRAWHCGPGRAARKSLRSSRAAPATNGPRTSPGPTPASRRCSTSRRRRFTRTTSLGAPFSTSTACSSPRRRPAIRRWRSIGLIRRAREGEDGEVVLADLGYSQAEIAALRSSGALL